MVVSFMQSTYRVLLKMPKHSFRYGHECAKYRIFLQSPVGHAHPCSWSAVSNQMKTKFGYSICDNFSGLCFSRIDIKK
jgi:hypothetical protein